MSYVQGFLIPCPVAARQAYADHASGAVPMFRDFGAVRLVEGWGDDVPTGKVNDFNGAVQRRDDEAVLFSWIEYPNRATYEAANTRIESDPRMAALGPVPFDGARMVYGGFSPIVDEGTNAAPGYLDGFVLAVPAADKQAYLDFAVQASAVFRGHGVTRYVEAWGDDVPHGETTDFHRAAHAQDGEAIVFSWCEWPDKATRDAGWGRIMADERMKPPGEMPFDGKRMIYGGFAVLVDA